MSVLQTDLYTLTMADTFVRHGRDDLVSFEVVFRRLPAGRSWLMVAGVREAVQALVDLRATEDELAWLRADGRFSPELVARLADLRFDGTVWAVPEGTCVPAGVPVLRVTAPRVQAALVESTMIYAFAMGLAVTAEGVERREEAALLSRLGCREFQGYLFARPLRLAQLERLLQGERVLRQAS